MRSLFERTAARRRKPGFRTARTGADVCARARVCVSRRRRRSWFRTTVSKSAAPRQRSTRMSLPAGATCATVERRVRGRTADLAQRVGLLVLERQQPLPFRNRRCRAAAAPYAARSTRARDCPAKSPALPRPRSASTASLPAASRRRSRIRCGAGSSRRRCSIQPSAHGVLDFEIVPEFNAHAPTFGESAGTFPAAGRTRIFVDGFDGWRGCGERRLRQSAKQEDSRSRQGAADARRSGLR